METVRETFFLRRDDDGGNIMICVCGVFVDLYILGNRIVNNYFKADYVSYLNSSSTEICLQA